jgi:hypothetical protein
MKKIDLALWICRIPYDTTGWMSGLDRIVLIFNKNSFFATKKKRNVFTKIERDD